MGEHISYNFPGVLGSKNAKSPLRAHTRSNEVKRVQTSYFRWEIIPTKFHSYRTIASHIFEKFGSINTNCHFHPIGSSGEDWVARGPTTGLGPPSHRRIKITSQSSLIQFSSVNSFRRSRWIESKHYYIMSPNINTL